MRSLPALPFPNGKHFIPNLDLLWDPEPPQTPLSPPGPTTEGKVPPRLQLIADSRWGVGGEVGGRALQGLEASPCTWQCWQN